MSSPDETPSPAPQSAEQTNPAPTAADFRTRARQAKVRMALGNLRAGKLNTATALLLEIYEDHPTTPEGREAGEALSHLAEEHEAAGRHRLAADLYKKLAGE